MLIPSANHHLLTKHDILVESDGGVSPPTVGSPIAAASPNSAAAAAAAAVVQQQQQQAAAAAAAAAAAQFFQPHMLDPASLVGTAVAPTSVGNGGGGDGGDIPTVIDVNGFEGGAGGSGGNSKKEGKPKKVELDNAGRVKSGKVRKQCELCGEWSNIKWFFKHMSEVHQVRQLSRSRDMHIFHTSIIKI